MLSLFMGMVLAQVPENASSEVGPATWTVWVGAEAGFEPQEYGLAGAWQFMRFYPENITINAGDKIEWKLKSSELHTVTFQPPGRAIPDLIIPENNSSNRLLLNPLVVLPQGGPTYDGTALTGSGQMDIHPGFAREYNLTFTNPGDFDYFCAFHSMMRGRVTVQPEGTPYPKTQEQIGLESAGLLSADMDAALKAVPKAENISARPGTNGTIIHEVKMGYGDGFMAWMRFVPTNLTIQAGDSVEWTQGDAEAPHTVSFLSGEEEPEVVLAEPQQMGPPKLVINPVMQMPAGGRVYSGEGYFNSGVFWGSEVPLPGPHSYLLTFDTPGNYTYICIFHDYMGMIGQITVLPSA
ncbi:MAG TPA: plastocyanin/azurin family copper-binding protein [Methanotrichaceae archaeon]|nr:plastocyanin/azurin family copper-binding protein [Methanotrichaceae archaeon]